LLQRYKITGGTINRQLTNMSEAGTQGLDCTKLAQNRSW